MRHSKIKPGQEGVLARTYVVAVIVLLLIGYGAYRLAIREEASAPEAADLAALAQCLSDNGAKFYGAYWCSHCEDQREAFEDAVDLLPLVECGVEGDPTAQSEACKEAGITSYPTWEFPDGSREVGKLSFSDLAERSGCEWSN